MKKNKTITAVYSFDNFEQYELFLHSVNSLYKIESNVENVELLVFLAENLKPGFKKSIQRFIRELNEQITYKIKYINFETGVSNSNAKFAWLFSPFNCNTKYILQLDNDTIIRADISNIFERYKSTIDSSLFLGRKDPRILNNPLWGEPVKFILGINNPYSHGQYINTGVVFFNRENALKIFLNEENLRKKIKKIHTTLLKNKFLISESDQNILYILWGDKFSSKLDSKYNYIPKIEVNKKDIKDFKNDNIVHYNIWYFNDLYKINSKLNINLWLKLNQKNARKYFENFYLFQKNLTSCSQLNKGEKSHVVGTSKRLEEIFGNNDKFIINEFIDKN